MLKSLHRCAILNTVDNGIIGCLRQYNRKMFQGNYFHENHQNHHQNNKRTNVNDFRSWINVAPPPQTPGLAFTVLNYNILSQRLLEMHSYLYQDQEQQQLSWNNRFYNLVGEIFYNNPDILCCQEVQKSHLTDIQERLRPLNYNVVYKKRTGDKPDGCAIFYKRDMFMLMEEHKIEFEQPGIALLDRENVAVVCKFALMDDPSVSFIVATTHLLYNPKRQDIRLAQVQVLLAELHRMSKIPITTEGGHHHHLPIILSGDFNLQPHSAPYNLIVNGMVNYENLSPRTLKSLSTPSGGKGANNPANGRLLLPIRLGITDECQHVNQEIKLYHSEHNNQKVAGDIGLTKENVNLFQTGVLKHSFQFASAYHEPQQYVSTFQDRWVLVDYIFYSNGSAMNTRNSPDLKLLSYLALPSADNCNSITLKIPNSYLGSDHLMLAARFFLAPNDQNQQTSSTKL